MYEKTTEDQKQRNKQNPKPCVFQLIEDETRNQNSCVTSLKSHGPRLLSCVVGVSQTASH
jgi:hypothetical protein